MQLTWGLGLSDSMVSRMRILFKASASLLLGPVKLLLKLHVFFCGSICYVLDFFFQVEYFL